MKISESAKRAILIGTLCSASYLAVYFARNILSAVTPQMLETGNFTEKYIGRLSSVYFILYAVGQLINGIIGDKIKARYMISCGLLLSGITNLVFSRMSAAPELAIWVYGMTGFFLAMIYGPMTKVVSENTEPVHATRCSLGYTFASFFGSPLAGAVAAFLAWQTVFTVSSIALFVMALVCFLVFCLFERKGYIKYNQFDRVKTPKKGLSNLFEDVKVLYRHHIVKFALISIITGVVRTAVVFWMPTYFMQYLNFSDSASSAIFTAATLVISLTTFISVFIYECLGHDMDKTILIMFTSATVFFAALYFVKVPVLNIIFMVLAVMSSNGAATMLWSRYCPSLKETGIVSGATGFLDFLSYMAAAVSSSLFANAVNGIGWGNLILIWLALMVCGLAISFPYDKLRKKKVEENAQIDEQTQEEM